MTQHKSGKDDVRTNECGVKYRRVVCPSCNGITPPESPKCWWCNGAGRVIEKCEDDRDQ